MKIFSINVNRSNYDIEVESLEERAIERNTCIYDSNDIHILNVGNIVMNIDKVMESGIVIDFENIRNQVIIRVGRIERIIVSMNKVRCVYPNNPTLISILDFS